SALANRRRVGGVLALAERPRETGFEIVALRGEAFGLLLLRGALGNRTRQLFGVRGAERRQRSLVTRVGVGLNTVTLRGRHRERPHRARARLVELACVRRAQLGDVALVRRAELVAL